VQAKLSLLSNCHAKSSTPPPENPPIQADEYIPPVALSGLVDASPRYLRTSQIRNLVNRLNGLADPNDALAAEWDVVVLRFVSGLTTVPARLGAGVAR
jgi:hypothetical protein